MVSSLRPSLCLEVMCSKTPFVPLDSYSLSFCLPPALCLQVVCSKYPVVHLDSLSLGRLLVCLQLFVFKWCARGRLLCLWIYSHRLWVCFQLYIFKWFAGLSVLCHCHCLMPRSYLQHSWCNGPLLRGIRFFQHQLHRFNSFLLAFTIVL